MKTVKNKEIEIRIPQETKNSLIRCLTLYNPNFGFKYHIDSFLYIIHTIRNISTYKKFKNLQKVPIYSKIIRYDIGKHYKKYLEYLLKHKFITTDNHYIVGEGGKKGKCKCYGIGKKYRNNKSELHTLTKQSILRKLSKWNDEKFSKMVNNKLLGHMYDMIKKVDIDLKGSKEYLDEMVSTGKLSKYKANLELDKCHRINDKNNPHAIFVKQDCYGRVHTNFTNISKHIREKFLYLEGEHLVGLDIISSQPAFLGTLFRDYFTKMINDYAEKQKDVFHMSELDINIPVDVREKYVNKRNKYTGDHIFSNEFSPVINTFGYKSVLDMLEVAAEELHEYDRVLEIGLYEFFQTHWEEMFEYTTRDEIKKELISYMFGQKNSPCHEKMELIWTTQFPLLTKVLKHFKNGSHKLLAQELQRKESELMFNQLCPRINEMGITYFTVHDSIVVKESVANEVYKVFDEILEDNDIGTGVSI